MIATLLALAAIGAAPRPVYHVDLERAVLSTADGKKVKDELARAQAQVEDEVHQRELKLAALQKELEKTGSPVQRAKYENEAEALQKFIDGEQAALDRKQDERLAPMLDKMRAAMKQAGALVLDQSEHPVMFATNACDATSWVARAYQLGEKGALPKADACLARAIFLIDLGVVTAGLEESKLAVSRLDAFQRSKQEELDHKQRELRGSEGKPEHEKKRLELAARFAAYKKELEERQNAEQEKADRAARKAIAAVAGELPGILFVEKVEDAGALDLPNCDMTVWLAGVLQKKATIADASTICPASAETKP